ncbi:hypothetical protein DRH27_00190 [Candidatus Falkowbacteria bacterium]|nr:MAG: hypothetical protein DRH27_00190 [Candidatus Falkowbacteria bacterium]
MKKVFILSLLLLFIVSGCALTEEAVKEIGIEEAKAITVDFINNNLMQPGSEVSIKEAVDEGSLYKMVINMPNGQEEINSYLTKDGKKFFPQVMDIEEIKEVAVEEENTPAAQPATADVPKAEKASVELFIMSQCPYGTQIEKGILPVLETLGDQIDFKLKFCDYAMHGKTELDEQLNQYCIQQNEPDKLLAYLTCFLGEGKGEDCLSKVSINASKLNSCVAATDKEFKVTELYNDKSSWKSGQFPQFNVDQADNQKYGITGSPGLVINGAKISSGRDSASLLKTICAGFDNSPEQCGTELSSAAPSPGFGFGTTGSDTDAGCGS